MRLTDAGEVRQERTLRRTTDRMTAGEAADAGREKEGVLLKREEAQKVKLDLSEAIQEALQKQAEERKKSSEKSGDALVDLGKVMEIARRIARGDKVPDRDEKKLMEYSEEMYQTAKGVGAIVRRQKREKHKSLWGDEEEKQYPDPREAAENAEAPGDGPAVVDASSVAAGVSAEG